MTEPHAGADPTMFKTRAARDGDEWVHQRLEVLLVQRQDRVVPHRHGGDRTRRERVPGDVDVPGPDATRPGVDIVRNVGLGGEPPGEGSHALIHYDDVRVPADALLGGEGQAFAIAQTRLGGGRIHHAMRTIGLAQKALDMMCERALSRETQGSLLADKQFVQGYIADSYAQLDAVPAVRALHRVDDRQAQRLPQGPQGHRGGEGADARRAARHRAAGHPGPRRARREQRDAVPPDAPRRQRPGPGRRTDRGPQGHRRPPGAARPPAERRPLADRAPPEAHRRRRRPSSPSTSSTRSGTCDRRRPASTTWLDDDGPPAARASRSSTGSSPAAARTRSTSSAAATCTAALRIPPAAAPATRDEGILREWRIIEALDGTDVPHTAADRRLHRPGGARPHLLPDGLRRRLVADGHRRRVAGAVRHRPRGRARAWPTSSSRASRCCRRSTGRPRASQDLGRPDGFHERQVDRWTAFLERIKGRELPGFDEAVGLARGPTGRSTSSPASCTATTSSPT